MSAVEIFSMLPIIVGSAIRYQDIDVSPDESFAQTTRYDVKEDFVRGMIDNTRQRNNEEARNEIRAIYVQHGWDLPQNSREP